MLHRASDGTSLGICEHGNETSGSSKSLRRHGAIPPLRNTSSWRGAQLKHRYDFEPEEARSMQ